MLIDAHAHLDRYDLAGPGTRQAALAAITQQRILTISNSMDLPSYERNRAIAAECDLVLPTFGVHPWNAPQYAHRLQDLSEAITMSPMLGEIGLDFYFVQDTAAHPDQKRVLEFFLAAAKEQEKIVSLHTKGAEESVLEQLRHYDLPRVIVHWYSGPLDVFKELRDRGAYFTVGIEVLYSAHIQAIAREIPGGQLLTETDNPGGPQGFLGRPGMPGLLKEVVQAVAEVRATTAGEIAAMVRSNLWQLTQGDPWLTGSWRRELERPEGNG
jgi:TatD DNase family protein